MRNYHHVRDFTSDGQERFAAFLSTCVRSDVSGEACRMDCLGTLEEQFNDTPGQPLQWQLSGVNTSTGQALAFDVDRQWLSTERARIQP